MNTIKKQLPMVMALLGICGPALAGLVTVNGGGFEPASPLPPLSIEESVGTMEQSVGTFDTRDVIRMIDPALPLAGRLAAPLGASNLDHMPVYPPTLTSTSTNVGSGVGGDPVPEPTTIALLGLGLVSMAGSRIARRRRMSTAR
jgi:hypothetical protein